MRDRWVLLAPERVVKVNPIAVEILKLCDGSRRLSEIVAGLAQRFNADPARVGADVRDACSLRWPRRGWPSYDAASARGPARRTDASLPARLPLLLEPGQSRRAARRDEHGRLEAHLLRSRRTRRAASAPLRRRALLAPRSRGADGACGRGRALHQPHHLGRRPHARSVRPPRRRRARSSATVDPGRRRRAGGLDRRLQGRLCEEARGRRLGDGRGPAAHRQRRHPSRQCRGRAAHGRSRRRTRRAPGRDRAYAILRLGVEEPRASDADARADRARLTPPSRRGASIIAGRW